jgi:DNA-binding Lrp family transcriptional regulator
MTINTYNEFKEGGFLMVPHIFAKVLSGNTCLLLSRLVSEYNYANNNRLNFYNDFLTNYSHLKDVLGFSDSELNESMKELVNLGFIEKFNLSIENVIYIRVFEKNILDFKEEQTLNSYYTKWDSGLTSVLNPIDKQTKFCDTVNEIKKFFDERLENPSTIPMIMYVYLNSAVYNLENKLQQKVFDVIDIYPLMYALLKKKGFQYSDFRIIIDKIMDSIPE